MITNKLKINESYQQSEFYYNRINSYLLAISILGYVLRRYSDTYASLGFLASAVTSRTATVLPINSPETVLPVMQITGEKGMLGNSWIHLQLVADFE